MGDLGWFLDNRIWSFRVIEIIALSLWDDQPLLFLESLDPPMKDVISLV